MSDFSVKEELKEVLDTDIEFDLVSLSGSFPRFGSQYVGVSYYSGWEVVLEGELFKFENKGDFKEFYTTLKSVTDVVSDVQKLNGALVFSIECGKDKLLDIYNRLEIEVEEKRLPSPLKRKDKRVVLNALSVGSDILAGVKNLAGDPIYTVDRFGNKIIVKDELKRVKKEGKEERGALCWTATVHITTKERFEDDFVSKLKWSGVIGEFNRLPSEREGYNTVTFKFSDSHTAVFDALNLGYLLSTLGFGDEISAIGREIILKLLQAPKKVEVWGKELVIYDDYGLPLVRFVKRYSSSKPVTSYTFYKVERLSNEGYPIEVKDCYISSVKSNLEFVLDEFYKKTGLQVKEEDTMVVSFLEVETFYGRFIFEG